MFIIKVGEDVRLARLQWVHGPQTVVMTHARRGTSPLCELQWVHGPQTVVMVEQPSRDPRHKQLQWVHGPQTVVMLGGSTS